MGEAAVYTEDIGLKNLQIKAYMRRLMASNHDERCLCCPYGYHVDLDFVDFAKDVAESSSELHKIRRYQRRLERAQTTLANKGGAEGLAGRIKEALSATNDAEFPHYNNGNNSVNLINQKTTDQQTKSDHNDIIFISNNVDDSGSRSSDEALMQSASSTRNNLNNSNTTNIFSDSSLPEDNYKKTLSNKSFVVSYEHLMSIREQMSASLKRVQELEQDSKKSQELRKQMDQINREKQELQTQLRQQIKENMERNSKSELYLQINSEALQWKTVSDLPPELLPNLERVFQLKSNFIQEIPSSSNLVKSKSSQTEVKGNLIVDTLSYLTNSTKEVSTQPPPKAQRRNFGVTVRPSHQHFTQQISFASPKSFKPEESLITLNNLILILKDDIDKKVGALLQDTLGLIFKNSYSEAVHLLKHELLSSGVYKSCQTKVCQTEAKEQSYKETQITPNEYYRNKGVQAIPILGDKSSNTREFSVKDSSIETDQVTLSHSMVQTIPNVVYNNNTQTDIQDSTADFSCQYKYFAEMNDISSSTDQSLLDDLISENIENAMHIIQEELKMEYESKLHKPFLIHSLETNENDRHDFDHGINPKHFTNSKDTFISQKHIISEGYYFDIPIDNKCLEHHAPTINCSTSGNISVRLTNHLVRSDINYLDFTNEKSQDDQKLFNKGASFALKVNTDLRNESTTNEDVDSENSDSAGTSPAEGCYYTTDRRIDYHNIDKINEVDEEENVESVTETEQKLTANTEKVLMINSNTIKQDGDTPPRHLSTHFPDNIKTACNLVTIWMNDSTTTCSKDLNESLTTIRSFWFELTRGNDVNLRFYLEKFKAFNSTLQERIINMTDPNGNTCLHYAVSEARWFIVQQILETEQADVNKTNKAGYTVLMLAAVSDILDETTLKLLISKSDIDKQSSNDAQQTALMLAASQGKTQLVQWLLEAGSSVNITDSDGSSALMCACDNGHSEVVRLFLSRPDTDTELEDKAGSNAMKIALDNSHKDIALLIFARNNLHKGSLRSKRRSGSSSHPTSPLSQRKFK